MNIIERKDQLPIFPFPTVSDLLSRDKAGKAHIVYDHLLPNKVIGNFLLQFLLWYQMHQAKWMVRLLI